MAESSEPLPVSVIRALDIGKQSRSGAVGLLIYDHMLTLGLEVEYVWSQKWSFGRVLYYFNGWLALLWLVFDSIPLTPSGVVSSRFRCIIYLLCDDIVTLVTTLTVQVILQMRVYAIYERSRKILLFLIVMCILEVTAMAVLIAVTIARIQRLPVVSTPTGCSYSGILPASTLFWTPALVFEPVLCVLVLVKAGRHLWRRSQWDSNIGSLPAMLARDSLLYFVVIFVELLTSTIIWAHYPHYINVIMPWSAALPSLLGSRLLLSMRERILKTEVMTEADVPMMPINRKRSGTMVIDITSRLQTVDASYG